MFKPLQSTAKSIKSKISASIAKGKKAFQNKIGKPVLSTAKKVIKSVAHKTAPLIKTRVYNILCKRKKRNKSCYSRVRQKNTTRKIYSHDPVYHRFNH
ncbi:hypothetical protein, partial [Streptococcus danieliae]|uniref:hypothetical protein n=1 Tax=Streptococcus danieliae TaxID=747656 RepID=UPI001C54C703